MSPSIPLPVEDASGLTVAAWKLVAAGHPVQPVLDFLAAADANPTPIGERSALLRQARVIFEHFYAHMPFKTDRYGVHPSDFIDRNVAPFLDQFTETQFHSSMIALFTEVRDAHTLYHAPPPYAGAVAFLPFQMVCHADAAEGRRYFVSSLMRGFDHPAFRPGAEVVQIARSPVDLHVQAAARLLPGGNPDAMFTRGAFHSTQRPLQFCPPPLDDEMPAATVRYRPPGGGELREIRLPWGVVTGLAHPSAFSSDAFSMSIGAAAMKQCGALLHSPPDQPATGAISRIPDVFEVRLIEDPDAPGARFGYLRIHHFSSDAAGADEIVEEFRRLLAILDQDAPQGLALDIRANPGGVLQAAERMLQMLTPGQIQPARFHFLNTAAILETLRNAKAAEDALSIELDGEVRPWFGDVDNPSVERLTSGQPLTEPAAVNDTGQVYHGPVILLIDALTYSAADIFAAGFQDHAIGPVMGTDQNTGGGGADLWSHGRLVDNFHPFAGVVELEKLPGPAGMSLAIRRCLRVGFSSAQAVEDDGVKVDVHYRPESVDDVIAGHPGLIRRACSILSGYAIEADPPRALPDGSFSVAIRTRNLDRLVFFLDKHFALAVPIARGAAQSFVVPPVNGLPRPSELTVMADTAQPGGPATTVAMRTFLLPTP